MKESVRMQAKIYEALAENFGIYGIINWPNACEACMNTVKECVWQGCNLKNAKAIIENVEASLEEMKENYRLAEKKAIQEKKKAKRREFDEDEDDEDEEDE